MHVHRPVLGRCIMLLVNTFPYLCSLSDIHCKPRRFGHHPCIPRVAGHRNSALGTPLIGPAQRPLNLDDDNDDGTTVNDIHDWHLGTVGTSLPSIIICRTRAPASAQTRNADLVYYCMSSRAAMDWSPDHGPCFQYSLLEQTHQALET